MEDKTLALLKRLIAIPSTTGSKQEQKVEAFLLDYLAKIPYFKAHPANYGQIPIKSDSCQRSVVYGLVEGITHKTVILMNHHDVVDVNCYDPLQPYAYDMTKITALLSKEDSPCGRDMQSGQWVGGRGSCDMKGGMAAQLVLLAEYAKNPAKGSLLFLSVADEESFSAGMREALGFLEKFRQQKNLDYRLAINSEPNDRKNDKQIVPIGSVGKLLTTIVVQGKSVHLGSYRTGVNPIGLLSYLVAATEGKNTLREKYKGEHTTPFAWLRVRDRKDNYDFSLPLRSAGYCSVQTFQNSPDDVLSLFKKKLSAAVKSYSKRQPAATNLPIYTYSDFVEKLQKKAGFAAWQKNINQQLTTALVQESLSYPEATLRYLTAALDFSGETEPLALLAFAPPYYPPTNSKLMGKKYYKNILAALSACQPVTYEEFFLGVSDCSYLGNTIKADHHSYSANTPLWGDTYSFAQDALEKLQIPFLLLGPWGKDLHQKTERVNIKSLTEELPKALRAVCTAAWQ